MAEETQLSRGAEILNRPVQTSLTAFMEKRLGEEASNEQASESTEVTESETTAEDNGSDAGDRVETSTVSGMEDAVKDAVQSADTPTNETTEQEFEVGEQKVKLKDLLNAYETREQISKRFAEVGLKEQRIEKAAKKIKEQQAELDFINEKFDEARELIFEGNSIGALQVLLSMTPKDNEDNPKTLQELIEQSINIAKNFHDMTDEERDLFFQKEELESKRRKLERKEKKTKQQEEEAALLNYYNSVLDTNKIEDAEIQQAVEDIEKIPKHAEEYNKKTDPKERINYCASWILGKRLVNRVKDGIAKVKPDLKENNDFLLAILNEVDANCTVEEVEAITREYVKLTTKSSSKASTEASKKDVEQATTPHRAPTETVKAKNDEKPIGSWNDILAKHGLA